MIAKLTRLTTNPAQKKVCARAQKNLHITNINNKKMRRQQRQVRRVKRRAFYTLRSDRGLRGRQQKENLREAGQGGRVRETVFDNQIPKAQLKFRENGAHCRQLGHGQ